MFLRASLAAQLGHFDETLGLGTPAGSGEDTDYAMRAWHMARRTLYYDAPLIGHRDKDMAGRTRYYPDRSPPYPATATSPPAPDWPICASWRWG